MFDLQIFLLGSPQIVLKGMPIVIHRRKSLALLAYLALAGQLLARDTLATLLWPDLSQSDARKALRRDLSELNLTLENEWIEAERESVGLRAGYWVDVSEFQHRLAQEEVDAASLIAAVDLYRGDFLAGFTLPDCPAFDEWQFYQGEHWRQRLASALQRLAGILSHQANYERAITYARRWLALDPLHEPAHQQLMRLYAQAGQQAAALRQYDLVRKTLRDELGVEPSDETNALYQQIRSRQVRTSTSLSPTVRRHNLPVQTTAFIGRETEVTEAKRLLLDEANCRLLNLFGPGGIGKTRLALAVATQLVDAFADGVVFVALTPISELRDVVPAIAAALHFTFSGKSAPKAQLLDYLAAKRLLLVLDNFEHLLEEADLMAEILQRAPDLTILVTSRERLNLQEEWLYPLQGLAFPSAHDALSQDASEYSALGLFTQRARQIVPHFAPSRSELADLVRICQLVEGMPLGLELAASWAQTLSCGEIAAEIERSLDFLSTTARNVQERHRSLNAVFEQTWQRLSEPERIVLQRLSLFRGGCSREAAEVVAGATLSVLSSLVDKALLRRTPLGRYELHELIRQFAEAQLQRDPAASEVAQQRHQDYFISMLETRTSGIKGQRQKAILHEVKADIDNVRLAWRQAVAQRDAQALGRSAECLFVFYLYSSGHYEGQIAFRQAAAAFVEESGPSAGGDLPDALVVVDQQENLAGFLLAAQGYFLGRTQDPAKGQVLLELALDLMSRAAKPNRHYEGFALLWLGWVVFLHGSPTTILRTHVAPMLAVLTETGDRWAEGWGLLLWANILSDLRPLEAEEVYARGSAVCRTSGDRNNLGYTNQMRSGVNLILGRSAQAKEYVDEAIAAFTEMGNVLGLGYAFIRQGQLLIYLGEYPRATHSFQQAIDYFGEARTEDNVIWAQLELGKSLRYLGEYGQAEALYRQVLAASIARSQVVRRAECLTGLGCLAYDQGDLLRAEELQREALALYQQLAFDAQVAGVYRHLGQVLVAAGVCRHSEAREILRQALELAIKHHLAPVALDVCIAVAQLPASTAKPTQVVELLALASQHEAGAFETRTRARRQLLEWKGQLPFEKAQTIHDKDQPHHLWSTMQTLLAELSADAP